MIKTTVIKAQTVREASETYGEDKVKMLFELLQDKAPKYLFEELEDEDLKKCLLFLLNGDIS
jgi:hypothetical protein